jgi:hypothetical protein
MIVSTRYPEGPLYQMQYVLAPNFVLTVYVCIYMYVYIYYIYIYIYIYITLLCANPPLPTFGFFKVQHKLKVSVLFYTELQSSILPRHHSRSCPHGPSHH